MARLFISHSSADNAAAIALTIWLSENGFGDVFLDIDPVSGLVAGERWQEALKTAADRCEAVLFLVSHAWLASRWCLAEFLLAKTLRKRIFGLLIETVPLDRLPPEMTGEWQICDLSGGESQRLFHVEAPEAPATVAFREAGLDRLRRGLLRSGLEGRSFPWPPPDEPGRAPYRGLKALEPQDAAVFFGRDAAIVRGMDQIRGLAEGGLGAFLVILGASGAGKSSFLRAGLWPRLARDDIAFLPLQVVRPEAAVLSGASGLAAALAASFARLGSPRARGAIRQALATGTDALGRQLGELLALSRQRVQLGQDMAVDPLIVLAVDQAEELFAPDGAAEAERFLGLVAPLLARGATPRLLLVLTIRSDRYAELQAEPALACIRQELFSLPPMPAAEFKGVIEGPAARAGAAGGKLEIAPELTAKLIDEAQGADALPLLGFTLERLFDEYGPSGALTLAQYESLGGGIGVLEAAVSAALADPGRQPAIPADSEAQLALLRAAFIPWLARIDKASRSPRRRVAAMAELPRAALPAVARLVSARLLVTDHRDGADVIEVAHESLLRNWPALRGWLEEDAVDLALLDSFERAAAEWDSNGRAEDWLDHRGPRLGEAERVLAREDFSRRLDAMASAYLAACRAREAADRAERRAAARRLLRRTQFGLAVSLGLLVFAGFGAWYGLTGQQAFRRQYGIAERAREIAERARLRNLALALKGELKPEIVEAVAAAILPRATADVSQSRELLDRLMVAANGSAERLVLDHPAGVYSAQFEQNGRRIVTASGDGAARVWDSASGSLLAVLQGHTGLVRRAVFSPDGHRIATAAFDGTARVWDANSGRTLHVLKGHAGRLEWIDYSPDGKMIITAALDKTVRIWEADTGKLVKTLSDGSATPFAAQYSPDGRLIVSGYSDGTIRIWDTASGQLLKVFAGHTAKVYAIVFSPDGKHFASSSEDGLVKLWTTLTNVPSLILTGHAGGFYSADISPDGKRIAAVAGTETQIWDAVTGALLATFTGSELNLISVAFSPDGRSIMTSSDDGTARVSLLAGHIPSLVLVGHAAMLLNAVFSHDGRSIVTASSDRTARVWDSTDGTLRRSLPHSGGVRWVAISKDDSRIVTAEDGPIPQADVWDVARGIVLTRLIGHKAMILSVDVSPDGRLVVTGSQDKSVRIWDAATGKNLKIFENGRKALTGVMFSPDGTRIVAGDLGNTPFVIDAENGRILTLLRGHSDFVPYASFSRDGQRIVTASGDKTARIWNAVTGQQLAFLAGHDGPLGYASFSPDGHLVVTAADDNTARVWDSSTGAMLAVLAGHSDIVGSAVFSPDGRRIVTSSDDKTARVWDVPDYLRQSDLSFVRAIASRGLDETIRTRYALPNTPLAAPAPPAQCGETGEIWPRPSDTPATFATWTTGAEAGNGACHQRLAEHFGDGLKPGAELARAFFHHAIAARLLQAQGDETGAQHERYRREALAWMLPRKQAETLMDEAEDWKPGQAFPNLS